MCFSPRSRLVLAKLEANEGVDAAPVVGTDDLFVLQDSAGIAQNVTTVGVDPASPTGYELPQAIATRKPTATYRIPVYGLGKTSTAVNLPAWLGVILQSCGHVNRNADATGTDGTIVTWQPDPLFPRLTAVAGTTAAAGKTFTLYDYRGRDGSIAGGTKVLQRMVGCRVSSLSLTLTVGQWAVLEVGISGEWVIDSSSAADLSAFDLDNVRTDFVVPNGSASQFVFAGPTTVPLRASSTVWSMDFGTEHIEGDDTSSGVACIGTQQVRVTGTTNPIVSASNIATWETAQSTQAAVAYSLATPMTPQGRTAAAGYTIDVDAPTVQLVGDYDFGSAAVRKALQIAAKSADATTPPITLTLT